MENLFRSTSGSSSAARRGPKEIFHRVRGRSEEHTSELQSHSDLVCRLLLEKKKNPDYQLDRDISIVESIVCHVDCLIATLSVLRGLLRCLVQLEQRYPKIRLPDQRAGVDTS